MAAVTGGLKFTPITAISVLDRLTLNLQLSFMCLEQEDCAGSQRAATYIQA